MATCSLGAILEYDVYLRSGNWNISMFYGTESDSGFLAWSISGSPITFQIGQGNIDGEGVNHCVLGGVTDGVNFSNVAVTGIITYSSEFFEGTFTIPNNTSGRHTLRVRTVDNILGIHTTGYIAKVGYMMLRRL